MDATLEIGRCKSHCSDREGSLAGGGFETDRVRVETHVSHGVFVDRLHSIWLPARPVDQPQYGRGAEWSTYQFHRPLAMKGQTTKRQAIQSTIVN